MTGRSFTDEELALIIRRAARVHGADPEGRHSVEDVQQIAAQVGLPPEIVAAVADDLQHAGAVGRTHQMLFGPSARVVLTDLVPHTIEQDDYPHVLDAIRSELKAPGQIAQIGPAFEWSLVESQSDRVGRMIITITPRGPSTKLRIETDLSPMRRNLYAVAVLFGGIFGLITSAELGAAPVSVVAVTISAAVAGWAIARGIWPRVLRAAERRSGRLLQRIKAHLGRSHSDEVISSSSNCGDPTSDN